ncbi:unnamed protein product, partial [Bubo scandiacus]
MNNFNGMNGFSSAEAGGSARRPVGVGGSGAGPAPGAAPAAAAGSGQTGPGCG